MTQPTREQINEALSNLPFDIPNHVRDKVVIELTVELTTRDVLQRVRERMKTAPVVNDVEGNYGRNDEGISAAIDELEKELGS